MSPQEYFLLFDVILRLLRYYVQDLRLHREIWTMRIRDLEGSTRILQRYTFKNAVVFFIKYREDLTTKIFLIPLLKCPVVNALLVMALSFTVSAESVWTADPLPSGQIDAQDN